MQRRKRDLDSSATRGRLLAHGPCPHAQSLGQRAILLLGPVSPLLLPGASRVLLVRASTYGVFYMATMAQHLMLGRRHAILLYSKDGKTEAQRG